MKNKITKLNSDSLLEVSGGFEEDIRNSWAKELGAINTENGKQKGISDEPNGKREKDNHVEEN